MEFVKGFVKMLKIDKGFGFITDQTGQDLFFHMSDLERPKWTELKEGEEVFFEIGNDQRTGRAKAFKVSIAD